jgi:hypothetical protein
LQLPREDEKEKIRFWLLTIFIALRGKKFYSLIWRAPSEKVIERGKQNKSLAAVVAAADLELSFRLRLIWRPKQPFFAPTRPRARHKV